MELVLTNSRKMKLGWIFGLTIVSAVLLLWYVYRPRKIKDQIGTNVSGIRNGDLDLESSQSDFALKARHQLSEGLALPDPPRWIDPLEGNGSGGAQEAEKVRSSYPITHQDPPMLRETMTEEEAFKEAEKRGSWFRWNGLYNNSFMKNALELRRLALESLHRWPDGKHVARFRYLSVVSAERLEIVEGIGEEMWAYAEAENGAGGRSYQSSEQIMLEELNRTRHPRHALAYGQALVKHSPASIEAVWAYFKMAGIYEGYEDYVSARAAYMKMGACKDRNLRIIGKHSRLSLALNRAQLSETIAAANALLKESVLKREYRIFALYHRARAHYFLKHYPDALKEAQHLLKEYGDTHYREKIEELIADLREAYPG